MPVQINEVIIRTVVEAQPCASPQEPNNASTSGSAGSSEENILERVFEIIQESKER
ncbi:MAG: hypothetical protein HGB23_06440 [Chlorobiaceae bacterium]|nr:hypothetical protein [Chlorobiaceae bacterium]